MDQKVDQKVTKIGKYEIVSELGQGGMGVVYKARDPFIGRMVALKTITPELVSDPEILKRFYREAQSAGTLQHPNIVTIFDLGEADGRPYIAMEFVEGESLQNIINRRARIPLAAKLKLVQQFCEGLSHAHKHGFVHRDVKPANILVTHEGNVKVVDFGIVHLESTNLTKTGMFLGTIHYASPEQINDGRVDSRSDLWSVTAVFYEFIAYKKAFDGSNIAAIIAKVLSTDPEPLSRCCPGVPLEIDAVISKGLKKNIEERYQSLDEMLGDVLPIARSMQQSFIGDLLTEAKDLREKGDFNAAQEKIRAVLILDNTHGEAKRLNSEIASEIHRVAPIAKAKRMVVEAEQAFSRGEYAEAARILGDAQELNPNDTQVRKLREKALQEQDRVRELREALTAGQKAMKLGDLTAAEQELHRVLQLDQSNPQAAELLEQIRQDRLARERDFRLKEALWQTDNLVTAGKYEEAQGRLLELAQDFPTSDEVNQKLQILDPLIRSRKLAKDGEHAFNQGEFAAAVTALTEALELNPRDAQARELRDLALQERDRLRQVREALSAGQRAMRQGDTSAAEAEFQKVLQIDPSNGQATNLLAQIRQTVAARERDARFRQALQHSDNLVAQGKLEEAQHGLLELQQEFPDSTEIDQKLLAIDQKMKIARLLSEGRHAFEQGEFGEAVRILTEAQELAPTDAQIRDLKTKAVQERDRLRQVREAISAGQRATRQGDYVAAEREYKRALQLDPGNVQAKNLLAQTEKEREAREREKRLKEALGQVDKLISAKKFDQAQRKLNELQQTYPDAEEILQKIQVLNTRRLEATPPPAPAPPSVVTERTPPRPAPLSEAARSLQSAEELRRSLQTPRAPEPAPPLRPEPSPGEILPVQFPVQGVAGAEPLPGEPAEGVGSATSIMASLKGHAEVEQQAMGAPPFPPPTFALPTVQAPPPRVEPKKAPPSVAPPRPTPAPSPSKMSPMILGVVIVLVVLLAVGGYLMFHHPSQPVSNNQPGGTTTTIPQPKGPTEKDLFDQAKAAQDAQKWNDAVALYTKVADMNGSLKDQALQAIPIINQRKAGVDTAKLEKDTYNKATAALNKKQYAQAQGLFQQVVALKGPNADLTQQAQTQMDQIAPILKEKAEFDEAEAAATRNDLDGAIARFERIANGGGSYASQAKTRLSALQKMKTEMAQNAALKGQFDAAVDAEKNNDLTGALAKFQAIAGQGGTFGDEAKKHIQEINDKILAANAQKDWNAALQAENSNDLNGALNQFKAIAARPGPFKDQAQAHVQTITDKLSAAADQQKFDDADRKQKSGDLAGAQSAFRALMTKPGPLAAQAADRFAQVTQLIADSKVPPKPQPGPAPAPGPSPAPGPVAPKITLNYSGDCVPWARSVQKGQILPDYNVDNCPLKPISLSLAPVSGPIPSS
jgi:eukaryotic-like serine/threonine-protein kinase